jgi:glycosyltransferase involved in cell wall biosynthesis
MSKPHTCAYKICVVTSYPAAREPRAPKHVVAALEAIPAAEVCFVDMAAVDEHLDDPQELRGLNRLERITLRVPTRKSAPVGWAYRKIKSFLASRLFALTKRATPAALSPRAVGLARSLKRIKADLYIAHNVDTLLPAAIAANANRARLIFDCMEFYADMGDSQSAIESEATTKIEAAILPHCDLVLATSESLAEALRDTYKIAKPLSLLNVPPITRTLPAKEDHRGLRLYWRNSVIGFGQRGLDDALVALTLLPDDVVLALQGRLPLDGGQALRSRIAKLRLTHRVTIHPPYSPGQAVAEAAMHDVGLCMERRGPANHEYTVSNKLFDYMMAGLAVIVPDLDGLARAVKYAEGGLIYQAGSPQSLAEQILALYRDPALLASFASASREYALTEGNVAHVMLKFKQALVTCVPRSSAPRVDQPGMN